MDTLTKCFCGYPQHFLLRLRVPSKSSSVATLSTSSCGFPHYVRLSVASLTTSVFLWLPLLSRSMAIFSSLSVTTLTTTFYGYPHYGLLCQPSLQVSVATLSRYFCDYPHYVFFFLWLYPLYVFLWLVVLCLSMASTITK